jgi:uncharacterized protein DUF6515
MASGSQYVVVNPPSGAVVYAVPEPTTVVYAKKEPYYYIDGTYYVASDKEAPLPEENTEYAGKAEDSKEAPEMIESEDHNYEVVSAPVGATVPYLPETAKKEQISGKTFYVNNGTYYRAFASDGDTVYMVVEKPA